MAAYTAVVYITVEADSTAQAGSLVSHLLSGYGTADATLKNWNYLKIGLKLFKYLRVYGTFPDALWKEHNPCPS